jgi:DNA polymerase-4
VLTRSLTTAWPPASEQALADTACALRERFDLPAATRFRLAGVGLSGFLDGDLAHAQEDLFRASPRDADD